MVAHSKEPSLISVIIVNYKVPDFVRQTIQSLKEARLYNRTEVIVVDNASDDDSKEQVLSVDSKTIWIGLKSNIGFGKACNVGARNASGKYLLFLNPDTVIQEDSLEECVRFMDTKKNVGIVTAKVINPDGTLQASCHRSFPTPFNTFSYLFGLSKLFPRSKLFGSYNLTYLDEDTPAEVDAVSGAFMFIRSSVFHKISGFDENFFMYGEDIDLCARVRKEGYTVWYNPATQIIHFKGKSSAKRMLRSRIAFYEAMVLFSRKYGRSYGAFFPKWLVLVGIIIKVTINASASFMASGVAALIDMIIVNFILWAGISVRFFMTMKTSPYSGGQIKPILLMHAFISVSFLITYSIRGVYSRDRYTPIGALFSGIFASLIFTTGVYFSQTIAFSRAAFAISPLVASLALVGWREFINNIPNSIRKRLFLPGKMIVVGSGDIARILIRNIEEKGTSVISGVVWPNGNNQPGEFEGYPVLGTLSNISSILAKEKIDIVLIATTESWYSHFIKAMASLKLSNLTIRWVPRSILRNSKNSIPKEIPLKDFKV